MSNDSSNGSPGTSNDLNVAAWKSFIVLVAGDKNIEPAWREAAESSSKDGVAYDVSPLRGLINGVPDASNEVVNR